MTERAEVDAEVDAPTPYDPSDPDEAEFLGIPFPPTAEVDPLPLVLEGVCEDCGTTVRLRHPGGIGGAGSSSWACPVCCNPMALSTPARAWTDRVTPPGQLP